MQNSFEKQVQEKMDELQFVPTEPVWQNIEKQIRTKKDRRRLLLWLPFLFLFLGGIWWLSNDNNVTKSAATIENKNADEKADGPQITAEHQTTIEKKNATVTPIQSSGSRAYVKTSPVPKEINSASLNSVSSNEKESSGLYKNASIPGKLIAKTGVGKNKSATLQDLNKNILDSLTKSGDPAPLKNSLIPDEKTEPKDTIAPYKVTDSKAVDSNKLVVAEPIKNEERSTSKWQLGFSATAGFSGIAKSFGSFSENNLMDAFTGGFNNSPSPVYRPSSVESGLSFSAGVITKKKLSNRTSFSTGLQYNYYSNIIAVGQMRRQDTTVYSNASISQSVSRFYLNSGTDFKDYQNRYHFIGIPLSIDWQVFKTIPLTLQAGLALQQLISTNALFYDARTNVYYSDKDAFKSTQLFSSIGLSYSIFNRSGSSLLVGPQLQYAISNLEKNGSGKHIFSLGLSAQFLFHKK